jgi:hypothetical protein
MQRTVTFVESDDEFEATDNIKPWRAFSPFIILLIFSATGIPVLWFAS